MLGAEIDRVSPHGLFKQFEEALSAKPKVNLPSFLNLGGSQFGLSYRGIIIIIDLLVVISVGKGIIVYIFYVLIPLALCN